MGIRGACYLENHLFLVHCLLCGFFGLNPGDGGGNGRFTRIVTGLLRGLSGGLLLCLADLSAGNGGFYRRFTRIGGLLCGLSGGLLLFCLAGFRAGDSGFYRRFARVGGLRRGLSGGLLLLSLIHISEPTRRP